MEEVSNSWVEPVQIARGRRGAPATPESMEVHDVTTVIWFDQGGTTGWAVFCFWPEAFTDPNIKLLSSIPSWSAGEFTGTEARMTDQMMDLICAWPERTYVGYEDFILRKFSMGRELLSPVRLGARLEDRMYREGRTLQKPQQPSVAMNKVTDTRQKRWGFWVPGKRHARDAVKHCITFASLEKERSARTRKR